MAEAFSHDPIAYRISSKENETNVRLDSIDMLTGKETPIKEDLGYKLNAIGFSPIDKLIYTVVYPVNESDPRQLATIDAVGNVTIVKTIPNMPRDATTFFNMGAIDESGLFYLKTSYIVGQDKYYVVDANSKSPRFGEMVEPSD